MSHRVTTEELKHREYWTPSQAVQVLGRSTQYWIKAFDNGLVTGYQDGKASARFLDATSCREYLRSLRPNIQRDRKAHTRAICAAFRERIKAGATNQ